MNNLCQCQITINKSNEIEIAPEKYNLPKSTQEIFKNLNSPVSIKSC